MRLKVCIAGVTGWVGAPLSKAVITSKDLTLVGGISRTQAGKNLTDVIDGVESNVVVTDSVETALQTPTDVLVDYTKADIVKHNVVTAIRRGVHVVVGSSGLTDNDYVEIHELALEHKVGVIAAGNFAITAVLLQRFACEAAKYLSHWEIIDYASDRKQDAPSGTARELASRLAEVRHPELTHQIEQTIGEKTARGATLRGSQIHSLRVPGFVIAVEAIFGAKDQRLSIRHDAGSGADPYIDGTLLAIRKVSGQVGLVRGLDRIMDE